MMHCQSYELKIGLPEANVLRSSQVYASVSSTPSVCEMQAILTAFITLLQTVVATPAPFELTIREATPSPANIQANLGSKLCKGASIYFPSSPEFGKFTTRWSIAAEGDILVVVVPACAKDVSTVVKFANVVSLPFLAINRGHGTPSALGTIKHGILIRLDNLDGINVAADGQTATLGGGVYSDQLHAKLAETNKVAGKREFSFIEISILRSLIATGSCGCVGIVGPGLGGGFGKWATLKDSTQILQLNVTTADGSEVTVSQSSNADLFWGMRGAGHNYGIVTSFKQRIFDYPNGQNTYYVTYIFTGDQLEAFFNQVNKLLNNGTLPKDANTFALYLLNPEVSAKPVIMFQFFYFGTAAQALPYVQPFLNLHPVVVSNATTLYKDLAHEAQMTGVGDPVCAPGTTKFLVPVGLKEYNVEANRKVYNLYSDMLTKHPALNGSVVQLEAYALEGSKAIDPAGSAYAHRDDNILVSFSLSYAPSPDNDAAAIKYAKQARQYWIEGENGRQFSAYTNYAYGDESLQSVYGYEPWRLQRLRELKKKWDPKGRFNFYNPIVYLITSDGH
ncbi:uncharacterized protein KY384_005655 [Bacidia gigantensis]|uniref:uncharacterized protein n=1 Tax=Bacidia gigantensis TaxID=2732470 RepID=UPI001D057366|nr:uncharacterized protein KY384_005655 [Bacidia gigantensis]KAG8530172.1 hypothetical protein KY384_005655 [Bacidia gigantensis]